MSEEAGAGAQAAQGDHGGQVPPQQDGGQAPPQQQAGAGGNGQDGTADTFPRAYVEELRRESAGYRTRAQTAEQQLTAAQQAAEARLRDAEGRATAAEQRMNELTISNALVAEAARLGFHDPEDAVRLADTSEVKLEGGRVLGVDETLKALAAKKPHLLKGRGSGDAGATGAQHTATSMNDAIRAAAGRRS